MPQEHTEETMDPVTTEGALLALSLIDSTIDPTKEELFAQFLDGNGEISHELGFELLVQLGVVLVLAEARENNLDWSAAVERMRGRILAADPDHLPVAEYDEREV